MPTTLIAMLATLLLVPGPSASAQDMVGEAADALARDPVYVAPEAADIVTPAQAERLRARIGEIDAGPVYIAVLPASAADEGGGSARGVAMAIQDRLGREGTYAAVAGRSFAAGSTDRRGAGEAATAAFDAHRSEGVAAVLGDYVERVARLRAGGGADGGGGPPPIVPLALVAALGGAFLLVRRRHGAARQALLAELRENVRDDLVALGDDIRALEVDVEMPGADPRAKEDYDSAVAAYDRADTLAEQARAPEDFEPVGAAVEEGRYAMTAAKASSAARTPARARSWSAGGARRTGTPARRTRRSPAACTAASCPA